VRRVRTGPASLISACNGAVHMLSVSTFPIDLPHPFRGASCRWIDRIPGLLDLLYKTGATGARDVSLRDEIAMCRALPALTQPWSRRVDVRYSEWVSDCRRHRCHAAWFRLAVEKEHQASCTASRKKGEAVARRAHLSANDSVASSCRSSGERATVSRSGCICTVVLVVGYAMPSGAKVRWTRPPCCSDTASPSSGFSRLSPYLRFSEAQGLGFRV